MADRELIGSASLADMFQVSKHTLERWLRERIDFPKPFKVGRRNLWYKDEIEQFIETKRKASSRSRDSGNVKPESRDDQY